MSWRRANGEWMSGSRWVASQSGVLALHGGSICVAQRREHLPECGDGAGTSVIARLFGKDD